MAAPGWEPPFFLLSDSTSFFLARHLWKPTDRIHVNYFSIDAIDCFNELVA
jgi:hypothetical protein